MHKQGIHIHFTEYLGKNHSLLMKFGQFMSYHKWKKKIEKFYKNCDLKTNSRPFCICKVLSTISIGKWNLWSNLLILDMLYYNYSNLSKPIYSPLEISVYRGFFENQKGSGKIFQASFSIKFLDNFSFAVTLTG